MRGTLIGADDNQKKNHIRKKKCDGTPVVAFFAPKEGYKKTTIMPLFLSQQNKGKENDDIIVVIFFIAKER